MELVETAGLRWVSFRPGCDCQAPPAAIVISSHPVGLVAIRLRFVNAETQLFGMWEPGLEVKWLPADDAVTLARSATMHRSKAFCNSDK